MDGKKLCSGCDTVLDISSFHKHSGRKDGVQCYCKRCHYTIHRRTPRAIAKAEDRRLRLTFGMSFSDYKEMESKQKGLCAICGKPESNTYKGKVTRLRIDHNHANGKVRKLLCHKCNSILGMCSEDISILARAIKYIEDQ